jgi:outer membrane protein assembly factor BamB
MHKMMDRRLVAGVVVIAAACGATENDRSTADHPTSMADTVAVAMPPSTVRSDEAFSAPVCVGGLLPALAAIDGSTGGFQWTYCSAEPAWREVRGATDEVVFVDATMPDPSASASEFRQVEAVIAVDARSGVELWRVPVARQQFGWPLGPFAGGGVVVVEVDDGDGAAIVGLGADTGETLWRVAEADLGVVAASSSAGSLAVAPVANTEEVVVLAVPTGLVGLERTSGELMWSSDVFLLDQSGVGVSRGPAAVDGSTVIIPAATDMIPALDAAGQTVMVPVEPSALVAVDASTGATLWQGSRLDHPVAGDGYVVGYVHAGAMAGGRDAEVIVVDAMTGEQLWSKPGQESYGDLWAIGDGAVYVNAIGDGTPRDVVAYELKSGVERWRRTTDTPLPGEPQQVADDGVVLLLDNLAVLSSADGTTRWTIAASVAPETPMSSVGHNAASIFVSFNGRQWTD